VVINNVLGKSFVNHRWSLRQGDVQYMNWFAYGMDPLINYLDRRLKGILVHSLPLHGPLPQDVPHHLQILEERYKVVGYANNLKPDTTSRQSLPR
jgi:hypothetical protein